MERLGITMLISDKSQLKRNVEQIGFQLALKTSNLLCITYIYRSLIGDGHNVVDILMSGRCSCHISAAALVAEAGWSRPVLYEPIRWHFSRVDAGDSRCQCRQLLRVFVEAVDPDWKDVVVVSVEMLSFCHHFVASYQLLTILFSLTSAACHSLHCNQVSK